MAHDVAIVGAGLSGNLLAILLARQGFAVTVYERGEPADAPDPAPGRSINLALAARGIHALERAGVFSEIEPLLLPMTGRIVHERTGTERFLAYGQRSSERIWSVARSDLNRKLQQIARAQWRVDYRFGYACIGLDVERGRARIRSPAGEFAIDTQMLFAADGAGSMIRRCLAEAGELEAREDLLDHGYKEISIAPLADGNFALDPAGLHIWPRGGFMLIALPNRDRSFTATLFLPNHGKPGFDSITESTITEFFADQFPDVSGLMPDLRAQFAARPVGKLGTVYCHPWSHVSTSVPGRHVLLIGDAAHAIVPFHGQGMNAAFEDCAELDMLITQDGRDWDVVLARFESIRRDNANAIAAMALENYQEMRDSVRDRQFERRATLAFALEREFPDRFIPRYSMVMFHPEIGYAEAERRGAAQSGILDQAMLEEDAETALRLAITLVEQRL